MLSSADVISWYHHRSFLGATCSSLNVQIVACDMGSLVY